VHTIEASKNLRSSIFWRAEKNLRQAKFKLVSRGELLRAKKLLRSCCGKPLAMLALNLYNVWLYWR
jgi:hypothetical protein